MKFIIIKKLPNASISENGLDDYMINILDAGGSGLNAMSISEVSGIPRATVIRKLNKLVKNKFLAVNNKKHYLLTGFHKKKLITVQKNNLTTQKIKRFKYLQV